MPAMQEQADAGLLHNHRLAQRILSLIRGGVPLKGPPPRVTYLLIAGSSLRVRAQESCPYACPSGFPPVEVNPDCGVPTRMGGFRER